MTPSKDHDLNEGNLSDGLSGLRVLVVEDSWEVATGLTELLKVWGAEVLGPVATTADALRLICERTVDAALVDVNLRDGEPAHGLIDRLHDQGIRVVVISGYTDVSVAQEKVVAVLKKPMKADLLLRSLRSGRSRETQ
jgi:DNA-binding NtrC family response regulator